MSERPAKAGEQQRYSEEMLALVEQLRENPRTAFYCAHPDSSPAVAIYEVPRGCVALPGLETQPLCQQHVLTDGSFEGMRMVVDLSIDGAWSKYRGQVPDFYIETTPSGGLELVEGAPPTNM